MWEFEPCPRDAARNALLPVLSRTDPARTPRTACAATSIRALVARAFTCTQTFEGPDEASGVSTLNVAVVPPH
jgi:hypothetical protein